MIKTTDEKGAHDMKHTKKILAVLSAAAIAASISAPAFAANTPREAIEEIPPVIETL